MSEPLNIDSNPIPFITAILGLSTASPVWCGLDPDLAPVAAGVYKLTRKFCDKFTVNVGSTLLHAATDMHGKGTKVPLCEVWREYGKSPSMHPIQMSWMPTTHNQMNLSNDIDIAKLLVDRTSSYPVLQDLEKDVFGREDKYRIFSGCLESPADSSPIWDYKNHWPGITIVLPDECERPSVPCPSSNATRWATGYYPDDYKPPRHPDSTRNILERFNIPVRLDGRRVNANWELQEDGAIFQSPPLDGETRKLIWILYRTCGTSIVWFSCKRELLDGFLGGLAGKLFFVVLVDNTDRVVGHFNALMLNVLHCDVRDSNLMFKVDKISPKTIIPDWPVEKGTYPKCAGMLGDWGYGADIKKENLVQQIIVSKLNFYIHIDLNRSTIQDTLPYMAADFLSSAGGPTQHAVHHDLESFFWALWVICVNMNGPYYTRRRWQDEASISNKNPSYSSSVTTSTSVTTDSSTSRVSDVSHISTISGGHTEMGGSFISAPRLQREDTFRERPYHKSQSPDVTTRTPYGEDNPQEHAPPIWATPGCHNLSRRDVGLSKRSLSKEAFVNAISPYFRQLGSEFINGLRTLHTYFVKSQDPKKDKLGDITHVKFCKILKDMRDSISPDLDHTWDDDIQKARRRYNMFLKAGGTHGITISVLDPARPPCPPKRQSEGEDDGKVLKKKASKAAVST